MTGKSTPYSTTPPGPDDFCRFVPWACLQFQVTQNIIVTKAIQGNMSGSTQSKKKCTNSIVSSDDLSNSVRRDAGNISFCRSAISFKVIHLITSYEGQNLVKIKISKAALIPRLLIKVIGTALPFNKYVSSIVIDKSANREIVYELSKLLTVSNITEVILDGSNLEQSNCSILLQAGSLKHLSLSKCKIDDSTVEKISEKLTHPNSASKTLCVLNLGLNFITDSGAVYLGQALRSNRQLVYLNLSGNSISDEGAICILNSLKQFHVNKEEIAEYRERLFNYYKEQLNVIKTTQMQIDYENDAKGRRKSAKSQTISIRNGKASVREQDDKSKTTALRPIAEPKDPFSKANTVFEDGKTKCFGNNVLCYLNLSYNNLSYLSVKVLLEVMVCQYGLNRRPRGLVTIKIDGNNLPDSCDEYGKIDDILYISLGQPRGALKRKSVLSPRSY